MGYRDMHERLFRVRALAFLIDLLIYYFAAAALAVVIALFLPIQVLVPSIINANVCRDLQIERDDPVIVALQAPADAIIFKKHCVYRQMFINRVDLHAIGYAGTVDGNRMSMNVSYPVDEHGDVVPIIDFGYLGAFLLPFVTAFFLASRGATPGKSMFYLRVQTGERTNPSYRRGVARELIRFAPFVITGVFGLPATWTTLNASPVEMAEALASADLTPLFSPIQILVLILAVFGAIFWFWFGSFIRWNGQAYWDRVTGLYVYDVGDESIPDR